MVDEYIKRGDAFDAIMGQYCACSDETEAALNGAIEDIRKIPAADVVEVVRCKNCLRWKRDDYGGVCDSYGVRLDKNWFCAGGEKREMQDDN